MSDWTHLLLRFWRLPSSERQVVLRALALHAGVRLKLWPRGLRASESLLSRLTDEQPYVRCEVHPERIARLVTGAVREGPFGGNCLSESVTLCLLLRRSGHESTLRIGARWSATGLEAHAWVEMNGVPLNDLADIAGQFPPFPAASAMSFERIV